MEMRQCKFRHATRARIGRCGGADLDVRLELALDDASKYIGTKKKNSSYLYLKYYPQFYQYLPIYFYFFISILNCKNSGEDCFSNLSSF